MKTLYEKLTQGYEEHVRLTFSECVEAMTWKEELDNCKAELATLRQRVAELEEEKYEVQEALRIAIICVDEYAEKLCYSETADRELLMLKKAIELSRKLESEEPDDKDD